MRGPELRRFIKRRLKDVCENYHFTRKTDTLYLRLTKSDVLHTILFELGTIGFTGTVAIQPLYCFEHTRMFDLSMGERIGKFKVNLRGWWDYENAEDNFIQNKELILKNGIPWFDRFGSPEGIIDFIANKRVQEYGIFFSSLTSQRRYHGFSLLYIGKIDEGTKILTEMANEPSPFADESFRKYDREILDIVKMIKKDPQQTPSLLQGFVKENKKALKIENLEVYKV
jgi:hypothetical protein